MVLTRQAAFAEAPAGADEKICDFSRYPPNAVVNIRGLLQSAEPLGNGAKAGPQSRYTLNLDNGCAFDVRAIQSIRLAQYDGYIVDITGSIAVNRQWPTINASKLIPIRRHYTKSASATQTLAVVRNVPTETAKTELARMQEPRDVERSKQKIPHRAEAPDDSAKPEEQAAFSGSRGSFVLFSWKDTGGDYRFALVPVEKEAGFLKTFQPRRIGLRGLISLKTALEKLSAGTSIVWEDDQIKGLTYPSIDYIDQITAFARSKGLHIELNPVVVE